jgi:hypothetical protein
MSKYTKHCTKAQTPPLESRTTLTFFICVCSEKWSINIRERSPWSMLEGRLPRRVTRESSFEARLNKPPNKDTSLMRWFVYCLFGGAGGIRQSTVLVVVHGGDDRKTGTRRGEGDLWRTQEKPIGPFGKI